MPEQSFFERVYAVVRKVPRGRVATYGQIARLCDLPGGARTVGWALRALQRGSRVPWHRVINARGSISFPRQSLQAARQRALLESEGVAFDQRGFVSLSEFQWQPRCRRRP